MKTPHITKFIAAFSLALLIASCKSEEPSTTAEPPSNQAPKEQKAASSKHPKLENHILKMLHGEKGDEAFLKTQIQSLGWDKVFAAQKRCLHLYKAQYGRQPDKTNNLRTFQTLSLLNEQVGLEDAKKRKKESLKALEKQIKKAVEREQKWYCFPYSFLI